MNKNDLILNVLSQIKYKTQMEPKYYTLNNKNYSK